VSPTGDKAGRTPVKFRKTYHDGNGGGKALRMGVSMEVRQMATEQMLTWSEPDDSVLLVRTSGNSRDCVVERAEFEP